MPEQHRCERGLLGNGADETIDDGNQRLLGATLQHGCRWSRVWRRRWSASDRDVLRIARRLDLLQRLVVDLGDLRLTITATPDRLSGVTVLRRIVHTEELAL